MLIIPKEFWYKCRITNKTIQEIYKNYGGKSGIYRTQTFKNYLSKEHNLTIQQYFLEICKIEQPKCACGCNKLCDIMKSDGSNFKFRNYVCGRNQGLKNWSVKAKITRRGAGNPMYGKSAWNLGKTKETDASVKKISEACKLRRHSDDFKEKQSFRVKKWYVDNPNGIRGMRGKKHTSETIEILRQSTLKLIKQGKFKQLKSAPHIKICNLLNELKISFKEEYIVNYWSFDFYLPKYDLYIEIDGDYFHSNPKIYPDGPKTKTQKINYLRDINKNRFCKEHNMRLIRFWECDINNSIESIKCVLQKLSI